MWKIWNTVWIRCWDDYLQLLGFWNFFVFFRFFPLKLVYFWTENRKNIYGCFFHSICATELKFGTQNNVRVHLLEPTFLFWFEKREPNFFWFFPLKLAYFWTKSRKNIYGCFFHSICATELKFGTKNNVRTRQSTLKTLIFAIYWKS